MKKAAKEIRTETPLGSVVFFRAVNLGAHRRFHPSVLAKELAEYGVVNIGAAGTFVVREIVSEAKLRDEILRRLPFKPELMICPARDVLALARSEPFRDSAAAKDASPFVSVMQKAPRKPPRLPIAQPASDKWEVKIIVIRGRFALSLRRRMGRATVYPNPCVEKHFGLPATTRSWNTIAAVCDILEK
jgi:uncharacterized protein (DUF1697 family)